MAAAILLLPLLIFTSLISVHHPSRSVRLGISHPTPLLLLWHPATIFIRIILVEMVADSLIELIADNNHRLLELTAKDYIERAGAFPGELKNNQASFTYAARDRFL